MQTLSKFQRLAESHDVDEIVAAATSAVREADNGREFLEAIVQRTGIHVRVISGAEEARLIHRAAVYGVDVGSVELTRGAADLCSWPPRPRADILASLSSADSSLDKGGSVFTVA